MNYPTGENVCIEVYDTEKFDEKEQLEALFKDDSVSIYSLSTAACAYSDSAGEGNWTHHYVTVVYSL